MPLYKTSKTTDVWILSGSHFFFFLFSFKLHTPLEEQQSINALQNVAANSVLVDYTTSAFIHSFIRLFSMFPEHSHNSGGVLGPGHTVVPVLQEKTVSLKSWVLKQTYMRTIHQWELVKDRKFIILTTGVSREKLLTKTTTILFNPENENWATKPKGCWDKSSRTNIYREYN